MFCSKCGNSIPNGAGFCASCGAPVNDMREETNDSRVNGANYEPERTPKYADTNECVASDTENKKPYFLFAYAILKLIGYTILLLSSICALSLFSGLLTISGKGIAIVVVVFRAIYVVTLLLFGLGIKNKSDKFLMFGQLFFFAQAAHTIVNAIIYGTIVSSLIELIGFAVWFYVFSSYVLYSKKVQNYIGSTDYMGKSLLYNLIDKNNFIKDLEFIQKI